MEKFEALYAAQNYEECILQLKDFVLHNNNNFEAYLLLAKSYYQLAMYDQNNTDEHYLNSFENFSKTINLNPENIEALLYRAYLSVYNLVPNKNEIALQDIDVVLKVGDLQNKITAYSYQYLASYNLSKSDLAISSLQNVKPFLSQVYQNIHSERLKSLANVEMQMGDVYLYLKNEESLALSFYEKSFDLYPYNQIFNEFLFHFAVKNNKISTIAKVGNLLIDTMIQESADYFLIDIITVSTKLINDGIDDFGIIKLYIRALHNDDGYDDLELFTTVKNYANRFPEKMFFQSILGNILYFKESYHEALPYYEKALNLEYDTRVQSKIIICRYHIYNEIITFTLPDQFIEPSENLTAGRDLMFLGDAIGEDDECYIKICEAETQFYYNAHVQFYDFFYGNIGSPLANRAYIFAMNCNNYACALHKTGQNEFAIPILEMAIEKHPFGELYRILAIVQYFNTNYLECIITINKYFDDYADEVATIDYVYLYHKLVYCYHFTNQPNMILQVVEKLEGEMPELEAALKEVEAERGTWGDLNDILNHKAFVLIDTQGMESSITSLEKRLESDADNENVYYALFQQFHIDKQYENAVACADNYRQTTSDTDDHSQQIYFYRRGSSLRHLNRLEEAILDLKKAIEIEDNDVRYLNELALCYLKTNETEKFIDVAIESINIYINNDFELDEHIIKIIFHIIDLYRLDKNKKEIKNLIKFILYKEPTNAEALKLKKEFSGLFGF